MMEYVTCPHCRTRQLFAAASTGAAGSEIRFRCLYCGHVWTAPTPEIEA